MNLFERNGKQITMLSYVTTRLFLLFLLVAFTVFSKASNFSVFIENDVSNLNKKLIDNSDKSVFHLISHGQPGKLLIEGKWLNHNEIAIWLKNKITDEVNHVNIYGCEFAKDEKGRQAVAYLQTTLEVSIAASNDITGVDGDWDLEVGDNGTAVAIKNYNGNLQCTTTAQKMTDSCDWDGDGILNIDDIDDDNDGIVDAIESPTCFYMKEELDTILSVSTELATFNTTSWGIDNTIDKNSSTAVQFNLVTMVNKTIFEIVPKISVPIVALELDMSTYALSKTSTATMIMQGYNGTTWVNLESAASARTVSNGTETITNTEHPTVTFEKYRLYGVAGKIYYGRIREISLKLENIVSSHYPKAICSNDHDSDGLYNHFDQDSDADGCFDAYESGARADNVATIAAPYGGNGLADALQGADTNATNYISTYSSLALNDYFNLCKDTDGDGIPDLKDIDDDNDGIVDAIESPDCFYKTTEINTLAVTGSDLTWSATRPLTNAADNSTATYTQTDPIKQTLTNKTIIEYTLEASLSVDNLIIYGSYLSVNTSSTFKLQGWNGASWIDLSMAVADNSTAVNDLVLTNTLSPNGTFSKLRIYGVAGTDNRFRIYNTTLNIGNNFVSSLFTKPSCTNDLDSNGLYNHLDPDSDGDGCFDAYESGARANNVDTIVGPYGGNGLADALQATDTNTTNYASTYDAFAVSDKLNLCADTDGDGIPDLVDIDDDNDGVLDAVESPGCFYTEAELSTLSATASDLDWNASYPYTRATDGIATTYTQTETRYDLITNKTIIEFTMKRLAIVDSLNIEMAATYTLSRTASNGEIKLQGWNGSSWIDLSTADYRTVASGTEIFKNTLAPTTEVSKLRLFGVSGETNHARMKEATVGLKNLVLSRHAKADCNQDFDKDSLYNHQDLDSDGDGCPDAVEAGVSGTLVAGGLQNNVPLDTTIHSSAIAQAPYGGNGLADGVQKASPDTNDVNYTSTFTTIALDTSINPCKLITCTPPDTVTLQDLLVCEGTSTVLNIPSDTMSDSTLYYQPFTGSNGWTWFGKCTNNDGSGCRIYKANAWTGRGLSLSYNAAKTHRWTSILDRGRLLVRHLNDGEITIATDKVKLESGNTAKFSTDIGRAYGVLEANDYVIVNYIVDGVTTGIDTLSGNISRSYSTVEGFYENISGADQNVSMEVKVKNSLREGHNIDNIKITALPAIPTYIFSSKANLSDTLALGTSYDPLTSPGSIDTIYIAEIADDTCVGESVPVIVKVVANTVSPLEPSDTVFCIEEMGPTLNLNNLVGNFQVGGVWTDLDTSGVNLSDSTAVDFTNIAAGEYQFRYAIANTTPCADEEAAVGVNILPLPEKLNLPDTTFCVGDQSRLVIPKDTTGVTTLYEQQFIGRKGYTLLGNCTGDDLSTCRRYLESRFEDRNLTLSGLKGTDLHRWSRIYDGGRMYVAHLNDEEAVFRSDTVTLEGGYVGNMSVDVSRWTGVLESDDYIMFNYILNGTAVGVDTIYGHMSTRMLTLTGSYDNTAGSNVEVALEIKVKNSIREGHKFDNLRIEQVPQPSTYIFSSKGDLSDTLQLGTSYDPMLPGGTVDTFYVAELSPYGCPGIADTVIVTSVLNTLSSMEGSELDLCDTTSAINLESLISVYQSGGKWVDLDSTKVDLSNPQSVRFGGLPYGSYSYEYVLENSPCADEVAVVGINILSAPEKLNLPDTTFCVGDQSRLVIPKDTTGVTTLYEQQFIGRKGYTLLGNCTGDDLSTCRRYLESRFEDRNLTLSGLKGTDLHRWSRIYDGGRMYVAHLNDEEAVFRSDTVTLEGGYVGNMSVDVSRWTGVLESDDYIMFNYILNGTAVGVDTIYGHMSTRMLTLTGSYDNTAGSNVEVALEIKVKNSIREGHKFDNLRIEQVPQPSTYIFSSKGDLSDTLQLGTSYDPMLPGGTVDTFYVAELSPYGCPGIADTVIVTSVLNTLSSMEGSELDLCDTTSAINLESLISVYQSGGKWVDLDSTKVDLSNPQSVRFGGLPYGSYSYEYVLENSPCADEVAVVGINILSAPEKLNLPDTTFCVGDQSRLVIPKDTTGVTTLYEQQFIGRKGYTLLGNCTGDDLSTCRRYLESRFEDRNLTLSGLKGTDLHRWSRIYDGGRMYVAHLNDEEAVFRSDTVTLEGGYVGNMSVDVSRWTGVLESDDYIMFNYILNGTAVGVDTIYGHMSTRMLTLTGSYDNTAGSNVEVALEIKVKNSIREGHKFDNLRIEQVPQPSTYIFSSKGDLSDTLQLGTSYDPMLPGGTVDTFYVAELSPYGCPGIADTVIVTSVLNTLSSMEGSELDLCDTTSAINLESLISVYQSGGKWVDLDSTKVDLSNPQSVRFGGLPYGSYSYEYVLENSPCADEVAVVGINILSAPEKLNLPDTTFCVGDQSRLVIPKDTTGVTTLYEQQFIGRKGYTLLGNCTGDDLSTCRRYLESRFEDRNLTLSGLKGTDLHRWSRIYDGGRMYVAHLNDEEAVFRSDTVTLEGGYVGNMSVDVSRWTGVLESDDYIMFNYILNGTAVGVDTIYGHMSTRMLTLTGSYDNTAGSNVEVALEIKVKNSIREGHKFDNLRIEQVPQPSTYIFSSKGDLSDTLQLGTSYDPMLPGGTVDTFYVAELSPYGCPGIADTVIVTSVLNTLSSMEGSELDLCDTTSAINLESLISVYQSGGKWVDLDSTKVDLSNPQSVRFGGLPYGSYSYEYVLENSPCADEVAVVGINILSAPEKLNLPDTTFCVGDQSRLVIPKDTTGVTTLYEQQFIGRKGYTLLGNCTGDDLSTCRRYLESRFEDRNLTLSGLKGTDLHRWSRIYDGGRMYVAHLNDEEAVFRSDTVTLEGGYVGNMSVDVSRWTGVLESDDYIMFNYILNGTAVGVDTIYGHMSTRMLTLTGSYDNTAGSNVEVALEIKVKNSIREGHKFDNLRIEQVPQPSTYIFSSKGDLSDTLQLGTSYDPMLPGGTVDTFYVAELSPYGCPGIADTVIVTSVLNTLSSMEGSELDLCDTTSAINLESLISVYQSGGKWVDLDSTKVDLSNPQSVRFGGLPYGSYSYEYVLENSPCADEVAVVGINILSAPEKLNLPDTTFCVGDQSRLVIPKDTTGVTTLYEQQFIGRKGYTLLGNCTGDDLSTCRRYLESRFEDRNLTLSGLKGTDLHRWSRIYDGGRMYVAHLNDEEAVFRSDTVTLEGGYVGNMSVDVSRWTGVLESDDYIMFNYILNGTAVGVDTIYGHMSTRMLTLTGSYDNTAGSNVEVALEIKVKNSIREGHKFDNLRIEQVPQPSTYIFSSKGDLSDTLQLGMSYDPMLPGGTVDTFYVAELSPYGCPGIADTVIVTSVLNTLSSMEGSELDLCDTTSAINLESLISVYQSGGKWVDLDSTKVDLSNPQSVRFGGLPYGSYSYEYVLENSPCADEVAVVGINILPARVTTKDTIYLALSCDTCEVTACPTNDDIDTTGGAKYSTCSPSPSGFTVTGPDSDGCYKYKSTSSHTDSVETCIITCEIDSDCKCDTTIVIILPSDASTVVFLAVIDQNTVFKDSTVSGNVLTNDKSTNGKKVTAIEGALITSTGSIVTTPNDGTLTIDSSGNYTYKPKAGFVGKDTITYTVCNDDVPPLCEDELLIINVKEVSDPTDPTGNTIIGNPDELITYGDTAKTKLLTNDKDPEGNNVVFKGVIDPATGNKITNGTICNIPGKDVNGNPVANAGCMKVQPDGSVEYIPAPGFKGKIDTLKYEICDDGTPIACTMESIKVTVKDTAGSAKSKEDNPPNAGDDFSATDLDSPVEGDYFGNDSDPDDGDALTLNGHLIDTSGPKNVAQSFTTREGGTIVMFTNGTYRYVPPTGFVGTDNVVYETCDTTQAVHCTKATISILVSPVVRDYGDLPAAWGIRCARYIHGTGHTASGANPFWLGSKVDYEGSAKSDPNAAGDAFDDGLIIPFGALDSNAANTYKVIVNSSQNGLKVYFRLYIDWDNNGSFDETHSGSGLTSSPDTVDVSVNTPAGFMGGTVNYRVVVTLDSADLDNTHLNGGEIEGYQQTHTQPVPVKLLYLAGEWVEEDALVQWATGSEINNDYFIVERSFNGVDYEFAGKVDSRAKDGGNSQEILEYYYIDSKVGLLTSNEVYYRLYQYDLDGTESDEGSIVLSKVNDEGMHSKIWPVPSSDYVKVSVNNISRNKPLTIDVFDVYGRLVETVKVDEPSSSHLERLDLSGLITGTYFVKISNDKRLIVEKIILNR